MVQARCFSEGYITAVEKREHRGCDGEVAGNERCGRRESTELSLLGHVVVVDWTDNIRWWEGTCRDPTGQQGPANAEREPELTLGRLEAHADLGGFLPAEASAQSKTKGMSALRKLRRTIPKSHAQQRRP